MSLFSKCVICGETPLIELKGHVDHAYLLIDVKCKKHYTPKIWTEVPVDPSSADALPGVLDEAIEELQIMWEKYNHLP